MTTLGPHTALVCLGANTPDASSRLSAAVRFIGESATIVSQTAPYPTAPEYVGDAPAYTNQLLLIATDSTPERLGRIFKDYETEIRRASGTEKPVVALDIDIVVWDKCTLRPADRAASYFIAGLEKLGESVAMGILVGANK